MRYPFIHVGYLPEIRATATTIDYHQLTGMKGATGDGEDG